MKRSLLLSPSLCRVHFDYEFQISDQTDYYLVVDPKGDIPTFPVVHVSSDPAEEPKNLAIEVAAGTESCPAQDESSSSTAKKMKHSPCEVLEIVAPVDAKDSGSNGIHPETDNNCSTELMVDTVVALAVCQSEPISTDGSLAQGSWTNLSASLDQNHDSQGCARLRSTIGTQIRDICQKFPDVALDPLQDLAATLITAADHSRETEKPALFNRATSKIKKFVKRQELAKHVSQPDSTLTETFSACQCTGYEGTGSAIPSSIIPMIDYLSKNAVTTKEL